MSGVFENGFLFMVMLPYVPVLMGISRCMRANAVDVYNRWACKPRRAATPLVPLYVGEGTTGLPGIFRLVSLLGSVNNPETVGYWIAESVSEETLRDMLREIGSPEIRLGFPRGTFERLKETPFWPAIAERLY